MVVSWFFRFAWVFLSLFPEVLGVYTLTFKPGKQKPKKPQVYVCSFLKGRCMFILQLPGNCIRAALRWSQHSLPPACCAVSRSQLFYVQLSSCGNWKCDYICLTRSNPLARGVCDTVLYMEMGSRAEKRVVLQAVPFLSANTGKYRTSGLGNSSKILLCNSKMVFSL